MNTKLAIHHGDITKLDEVIFVYFSESDAAVYRQGFKNLGLTA